MAKKTAKKKVTSNNGKPPTKTQIYSYIADDTGLTKADVSKVFDSLNKLIKTNVGKRTPGQFTIPNLVKIARFKKKATKARMGRNPRTGEPTKIEAKPARTVIKVRPLKGLKEML